MARTAPKIGEMRYPVWICAVVERPDPDTPSTLVDRPGVFRAHARIRVLQPYKILSYQAVFGSERTPTTEIMIRDPPDVKVDIGHWVYQIGPPAIWYRVRSVEPIGDVVRFLALLCSIDTINDPRSDPATQESPPPRWDNPDVAPMSYIQDRI